MAVCCNSTYLSVENTHNLSYETFFFIKVQRLTVSFTLHDSHGITCVVYERRGLIDVIFLLYFHGHEYHHVRTFCSPKRH